MRATTVVIQLFDAPPPGAAQSPSPASPVYIGTTRVPVPQGVPEVTPVNVRLAKLPSTTDAPHGWFNITAASGSQAGAVYVRLSFAERRAQSGYCESIRLASPVAQPVDSYSNALFILCGTHSAFSRARDSEPSLEPLHSR